MISLHHKMNLAIIGLAPVAFLTSGSMVQMPFDLLLGVVLPLHGHIGMNMFITDYAKKAFGKAGVMPTRFAMAAFTGVTMLGLLNLNLNGKGITETVKDFWRPAKA